MLANLSLSTFTLYKVYFPLTYNAEIGTELGWTSPTCIWPDFFLNHTDLFPVINNTK